MASSVENVLASVGKESSQAQPPQSHAEACKHLSSHCQREKDEGKMTRNTRLN